MPLLRRSWRVASCLATGRGCLRLSTLDRILPMSTFQRRRCWRGRARLQASMAQLSTNLSQPVDHHFCPSENKLAPRSSTDRRSPTTMRPAKCVRQEKSSDDFRTHGSRRKFRGYRQGVVENEQEESAKGKDSNAHERAEDKVGGWRTGVLPWCRRLERRSSEKGWAFDLDAEWSQYRIDIGCCRIHLNHVRSRPEAGTLRFG